LAFLGEHVDAAAPLRGEFSDFLFEGYPLRSLCKPRAFEKIYHNLIFSLIEDKSVQWFRQ
jgi:hypothetical protein